MEFTCAMLASYVELASDGKASMISGGIDNLRVQGKFPATLPIPLYFLVKTLYPPEECGREYLYRIEIVAPDGSMLLESEQRVTAPPPADNHPFTKLDLVLVFAGLTFPAPGRYWVRVLIDGKEAKKLLLRLEEVPIDQPAN